MDRTAGAFLRKLTVVLLGAVALAGGRPSALAPDSIPALEAMASAERAFARAALEKGIRDAFVEFFADDSIGFYPTPINAREFYRQQPASPLTLRLEWEPRVGDVAAAGDLGWLTGPYTLTDTASGRPPRVGCYFSIWRKQPDGTWKVLMDVGIPTPEPVTFARDGFVAVDQPGGRFGGGSSQGAAGSFIDVDRTFASRARDQGQRAAYETVLTGVSRLHVPGRQPVVGRDAVLAWTEGRSSDLRVEPEAGEVATSADLGFTRGSYEEAPAGAASPKGEKGYYVRVWKRIESGAWTLAAEVRSPLPTK